MKRFIIIWMVVFLTSGACGCKRKNEAEATEIWEAWTIIDTAGNGFNSYAMDESGAIYFHVFYQDVESKATNFSLKKYDVSGNEVYVRDYFEVLGNTAGLDSHMDACNGTLYIAVFSQEMDQMFPMLSLYKFQETMEKAENIHTFLDFSSVARLLVSEDEVYLLGKEVNGTDDMCENQMSVVLYSLRTGEERVLGIPSPIDIALNSEGNLVFSTQESDGIHLYEYNASTKQMRQLSTCDEAIFSTFALQGENDIVYASKLDETVIWSNMSDMSAGTEIYPWGVPETGIVAKGPYVACRAENNHLVRINTDKIAKQTKEICLLVRGNTVFQTPYSCGYKMKRVGMSEDKIALKVMAMDKDYDLCLLNSQNGCAHNVMERGNYYPLNKLEGIESYFDACFPYVEKVATKDNGDIWMLPIRVDIPIYIYDEAMQEGFSTKMNYEEFLQVANGISDEESAFAEKLNLSAVFMNQYFSKYHSLDTDEFRKYFQLMKSACESMQDWSDGMDYQSVYREGNYIIRNEFSSLVTNAQGIYGADAVACGYPVISQEDSNLATCAFFVVNPKSEHLNETIHYLESYIKYMLNKDDIPHFFEREGENLSEFDRSLQDIYRNANIGFYLDSELLGDYIECIKGTKSLEEYIAETEPKLKIYFNE